jgi:guanidinopropionase
MSRLIRRVNAASAIAPFDLCHVADVGDVPQNPLDLLESLQSGVPSKRSSLTPGA